MIAGVARIVEVVEVRDQAGEMLLRPEVIEFIILFARCIVFMNQAVRAKLPEVDADMRTKTLVSSFDNRNWVGTQKVRQADRVSFL